MIFICILLIMQVNLYLVYPIATNFSYTFMTPISSKDRRIWKILMIWISFTGPEFSSIGIFIRAERSGYGKYQFTYHSSSSLKTLEKRSKERVK